MISNQVDPQSHNSHSEEASRQQVYDLNSSAWTFPIKIPLPPEEHVAAWQRYEEISRVVGVWETLKARLVQLQFPIQSNISKDTAAYRTATRRGEPTTQMPEATGLVLQEPARLQLRIYQSVAGAIPVLITASRADFVSLVQAFTKQNEPAHIPQSMGACMVAGYNNWDRVRTYRAQWEAENPDNHSEMAWQAEFRGLIPQKHLYQDRFIILSDGPYSGIAASDLGLSEDEWRRLSLTIRLEHECTHYFTKRVFGIMRKDVFDELLADYAGIIAAAGHYRADWFLRFMGLESFPDYREGGRLQNYLGELPPSSETFKMIQAQVKAAAENLEQFDTEQSIARSDVENQALVLLAITSLTLEELASAEAYDLLLQSLNKLKEKQRGINL